AIFTDDVTQWGALAAFFHDVFLPYLVGGLIPGIIAGLICYYLSAPIIAAYQKHRRTRLKDRFDKLKAKLQARKEERQDKI
ncbi:DUF2062 domain-containing protein, partial [Candidatus Falkowbacteria bacterium]|nr:DUF2062 domain-containing protein [Candidatus Falkowbacteria bacterium]